MHRSIFAVNGSLKSMVSNDVYEGRGVDGVPAVEIPGVVSFDTSLERLDLFPEDFDRFDDIVETSTQRGNFIKRLYKFSKRKVTRSSSFALESLSDNVQRERRNSFVVSGNDEFLSSGFVTDPVGDPTRQEGKGEKLDQQTHKVETSANFMYGIKGDSSKNELKSRGAKKTRKRHTETIPRENSLIW